MKAKLFLLLAVFSSVPLFATRSQTVVTFDDLPGTLTNVPNGYQGLSWSNFYAVNAIMLSNFYGYVNGYNYGMVSASNVAYNGFGNPAEIDSATSFNFLSAYLTGAWNSNLNVEVQGFMDTNLVYDETKVVSLTNATLFTFNFLDIDRLYFNSYGGQFAFQGNPEYNFVMDNFMFEYIPEPSSLLLTILGVLTLWGFRKRSTT